MATPFTLPISPEISPDLSGIGTGLTYAECFAITAATRHLPEGWYARPDRDGKGRSIVLICSRDEWDQQAPLFLVWRQQGRLHLGKGHGFAEATELGRFASVAGAMAVVGREVRRYVAVRPTSILLC